MVADIFEEFEPPSKKFLATPLDITDINRTYSFDFVEYT